MLCLPFIISAGVWGCDDSISFDIVIYDYPLVQGKGGYKNSGILAFVAGMGEDDVDLYVPYNYNILTDSKGVNLFWHEMSYHVLGMEEN